MQYNYFIQKYLLSTYYELDTMTLDYKKKPVLLPDHSLTLGLLCPGGSVLPRGASLWRSSHAEELRPPINSMWTSHLPVCPPAPFKPSDDFKRGPHHGGHFARDPEHLRHFRTLTFRNLMHLLF